MLGRAAELIASPGTYDQKHVARIAGVPHCVAYGPGILDLAHQPDEYCTIDDMCGHEGARAVDPRADRVRLTDGIGTGYESPLAEPPSAAAGRMIGRSDRMRPTVPLSHPPTPPCPTLSDGGAPLAAVALPPRIPDDTP